MSGFQLRELRTYDYDALGRVNSKVQVMNDSVRKMKDKPPTDVKSANISGHIPVPSGNSIR